MIDYFALRLLIRQRLLGLSVCTTGTAALSASASGYVRAAGSFLTDGFSVGMEVMASGFAVPANNKAHVITGVTATTLSVAGGLTAEVVGAGRSCTVGLPATRLWDNLAGTPKAGTPYIEEDFVTDNPPSLVGMTAGGVITATPLYVIRWYGIADIGTAAIDKSVEAVLALFPSGASFLLSNAAVARVRGDILPSRTRLNQGDPGFVRCTITIPLRVLANNTSAAPPVTAPVFGGGLVFG